MTDTPQESVELCIGSKVSLKANPSVRLIVTGINKINPFGPYFCVDATNISISSWLPEAVLLPHWEDTLSAVTEPTGMTFEQALTAMKEGRDVRRNYWPNNPEKPNSISLVRGFYYIISSPDLLADDWEVVE